MWGPRLPAVHPSLRVTHQAVSVRLKSMGMIQKQNNWIPYELSRTTPILQNVNDRSNVAKSVKTYFPIEKLDVKNVMRGLTPPAVFSRRYSFQSSSTPIGVKGNELYGLLSTSDGAIVTADVLFNLW